jgi:hypothetical protein
VQFAGRTTDLQIWKSESQIVDTALPGILGGPINEQRRVFLCLEDSISRFNNSVFVQRLSLSAFLPFSISPAASLEPGSTRLSQLRCDCFNFKSSIPGPLETWLVLQIQESGLLTGGLRSGTVQFDKHCFRRLRLVSELFKYLSYLNVRNPRFVGCSTPGSHSWNLSRLFSPVGRGGKGRALEIGRQEGKHHSVIVEPA